jgi:N4-gp56 family major capsid protein
MADTGVTETVATAVDVVAAIVQSELIAKGIMIGTITDYSSWLQPGAKQVSIPNAGSFTAGDKLENTASTTQALTFVADALLLNKNKHIVARLEDIAREQSAVDVEAIYVERMASAMVAKIEADIYAGILKAANDRQLTGTDVDANANQAIAKADIVAARRALDEANVPNEERFLLVSPKQEAEMLRVEGFVDASKYGSNEPVVNGEIGRVYGFRVVKSSLVGDNVALAYHRSHVAFAMSQEMKFEKQRADLTFQADNLSLATVYGVKQLDSGNRGYMMDETAVA